MIAGAQLSIPADDRILVLGATGMLGHKLVQVLHGEGMHVIAASRSPLADPLLSDVETTVAPDLTDPDALETLLHEVRPDIVLNCVGLIKQRESASNTILAIALNSLLPHVLERWTESTDGRVVHFSTDCVFSGREGMRREQDNPDPVDVYGRSKLLGEISGPRSLTLRTSIVGRELSNHQSLVDWFLAQSGTTIQGFTNALYSGLSTNEMAQVVIRLLELDTPLSGLFHVAGPPINKYDLLILMKEAFEVDVEIEPYGGFVLDRTLDSSLFNRTVAYYPPTWQKMINAMASDPTDYTRNDK